MPPAAREDVVGILCRRSAPLQLPPEAAPCKHPRAPIALQKAHPSRPCAAIQVRVTLCAAKSIPSFFDRLSSVRCPEAS